LSFNITIYSERKKEKEREKDREKKIERKGWISVIKQSELKDQEVYGGNREMPAAD